MGFRVWGLGFGVSGLGFGVSGFGFGVSGLGFGVSGLGFRVSGFGFGVWGLGSRVSGVRLSLKPMVEIALASLLVDGGNHPCYALSCASGYIPLVFQFTPSVPIYT